MIQAFKVQSCNVRKIMGYAKINGIAHIIILHKIRKIKRIHHQLMYYFISYIIAIYGQINPWKAE